MQFNRVIRASIKFKKKKGPLTAQVTVSNLIFLYLALLLHFTFSPNQNQNQNQNHNQNDHKDLCYSQPALIRQTNQQAITHSPKKIPNYHLIIKLELGSN